MNEFQLAGGSIVGRNHVGRNGVLIGRNNQDAFGWIATESGIVAVVADGCSKGQHSEVGSKAGVKLFLGIVSSYLAKIQGNFDDVPPERFWSRVRSDLLANLHDLALKLSGNESFLDTVGDYLLFTLVGAIITPRTTQVVSIGDGVVINNNTITTLGPFPENKPPYLAYGLFTADFPDLSNSSHFQLSPPFPTEELSSLFIGTDGVDDLIAAEDEWMPNQKDRVGPVNQFWEDSRYFRNGDLVRRRLALMNSDPFSKENTPPLYHNGLLPDDTTLVVVRRRPEGA